MWHTFKELLLHHHLIYYNALDVAVESGVDGIAHEAELEEFGQALQTAQMYASNIIWKSNKGGCQHQNSWREHRI